MFVLRPGCSRSSWGLHRRIPRCRAGGKDIVRVLLLDISGRELVFPDRFLRWGAGRGVGLIFPFSSHVHFPFGFAVSWVNGGRKPWFGSHLYILFYICLDFGAASRIRLRRKGKLSHFLLAWVPGVVWRLHLLRTYLELGWLGLVKHSGLGSGRVCKALC